MAKAWIGWGTRIRTRESDPGDAASQGVLPKKTREYEAKIPANVCDGGSDCAHCAQPDRRPYEAPAVMTDVDAGELSELLASSSPRRDGPREY